MDWTTVSRSLQSDFIERLKSGCLLVSDRQGQNSEKTVISGNRLENIRRECWKIAEKRQKIENPKSLFFEILQGAICKESIKDRFPDRLIQEDDKDNLTAEAWNVITLKVDPSFKLKIKCYQGSLEAATWSITAQEAEEYAAIVCLWMEEKVSDLPKEHHLVLAGFLPTHLLTLGEGEISKKIDDLLYSGSLRSYLETLEYSKYLSRCGLESYNQGQYQEAIAHCTLALELNPDNADAYHWRGWVRYATAENQKAIEDFTQAIRIDLQYAEAYLWRAAAHYVAGSLPAALADCNRAIEINPQYGYAYLWRAIIHAAEGQPLSATQDCELAIYLNPQEIEAYKSLIADRPEALESFQTALTHYLLKQPLNLVSQQLQLRQSHL